GNGSLGVGIGDGSTGNTIGGTTATARNVIAASGTAGVLLTGGATGNFVRGNYIGLDRTGAAKLPNFWGMQVIGGANANTIGGTTPAARNVISGNADVGVLVLDA